MISKYCNTLSGILVVLSLLLCVPTVSAYWKKYASYKVYIAEGPFTGKRIECYSDCLPETDNCAIKYVYGGITLYVKYENNLLGEWDNLSSSKLSRVKRIFNTNAPGVLNNEENEAAYAVSKDGKYELFIQWGGTTIPNAWLYKNGKFASALWFY